MATIPASENEFPEVLFAEGAAPAAPATGLVKAYAKADGLLYSKDDAGAETALGAAAHIADTTDAHDASAISVDPTGLTVVAGTDVQTAIGELDAGIAGGGIPATIFDAQGDIIVASAADTAARLALGTPGQALVGNGTTAVWGVPAAIGCLAYHNTTQTVNNAVVPLNSEVFDDAAFHDTGSNTSRLTVPTDGLYVMEYGGNIASLAVGEFMRIRLNGSTVISMNEGGTSAVGSGYVSGQCIRRLSATDYVELFFTGNRTLGHASAFEAQTHFSIARIGA